MYLLSIFLIPNSGNARLTALPLTDDADREFSPVVTSRQALAKALALLPQHNGDTPLSARLADSQPVQIAVRSEVLHTLLTLLERVSKQQEPPIH